MMKFFTFFLFILIGISTVFAQQTVDEKSFETAFTTLKEKTNVPLKLPTYFVSPAYLTAKEKRKPVKAFVSFAERDSFELEFCFSEICQGVFYYGSVSGEKITPKTEPLKFDKTVKLVQGITGYFQDSSCGSSCGDAIIFWEQDGFRHDVSLHDFASLQTLVKFANSAIENSGLNIPGKANNAENQSIDAFLKSVLKPGDDLEFEAKGDLNGDGLADWSGIIQRKKSPPFVENENETDKTLQLYVLLRNGKGGYRLAEKSKETGIFGLGGNYIESLEIERSSIFLHFKSNARYGSFSQFRLFKGEWRLIGWREIDFDAGTDKFFEKDRNLLTGAVIEKRQTGNRKPFIKRYRKKFPRILLKDFNLFGWNEIE